MALSIAPYRSHCSPLENVSFDSYVHKVTMLEANHCPGAALIHFRLIDGRCYLHTGDFRASKLMQSHLLLTSHRVNLLYLDTTYCHPKYRRRVLQSFGWPELSGKLCSHGKDTPLHILPLSSLRHETLKKYLDSFAYECTTVLAFRPTGWTYSETLGKQLDLIRPTSKGNITIYGVPYSEHSSFSELREFVQFLKPDRIIPTVNVGNAANIDKMQPYFREWLKS
ncbi:hypothetical protein IFM89_000023 [Coptis chinensis]|uniref:DNA repair metallo-beta-lactamase domain-containing protein n=1 Tax=Coptis chinensis TaxID=261450 RepID=A0A835IKD3_9MAGN|nr:hypothetical protein IFM89_000023 [Coptis chinensis]